jgi:hypothetical protein
VIGAVEMELWGQGVEGRKGKGTKMIRRVCQTKSKQQSGLNREIYSLLC